MKILLLVAIVFTINYAAAQDETVKKLQTEAGKTIKKEEDTLQRTWRTGGIYSLNISQGCLSNWAAGGDDFSL